MSHIWWKLEQWIIRYSLGTFGRIMELSFPRTFAPGSESSIGGTFAPWNFRPLELSLPGTFVPGSESDVELSLSGTFAPWNFRSRERV